MPTPKRLAITISGAVSLGSYEAGVLYELLTALAEHNNTAATTGADPIFVDVVTGASAGAMTATIAAQMLAGNGTQAWSVFDNPFYNAWVKMVDIKGLVQLGTDENPMHSLLSSNAVAAIADRMIPTTWSPNTAHPVAAPELQLGLALTNLIGVDVTIDSPTGTPFPYTKYQDRLTADIHGAVKPDWDRIRAAALASGAFPVAFRVRELLRRYNDYFPGAAAEWDKPFVYTDGGVFDNQPLGLARELVSNIDDPWDNDRRFYLFVSPSAKSSSIAKNPLQAKEADLLKTLGALVGAIFNQARFRDWAMALKMNQSLALLDDRAVELAELLLATQGLVPSMIEVAGALAKAFTDAKEKELLARAKDDEERMAVPGLLGRERERLQKVFAVLVPEEDAAPVDYHKKLVDDISPEAAAAWIDALLVFEYAARLEEKSEMIIYGVTATDQELASAAISAFAGFFDERFRHHDYEVGRQKTREWLATLSTVGAPGVQTLAPIHYRPAAGTEPKPDATLRNLPLESMPVGPRKMLLDAVMLRADTIIDEHVTVFAIGWAIRLFLKNTVRNVVGKKLGL